MECPKCGNNIQESAKECSACGTKFENNQQQNVENNINQEDNNKSINNEQTSPDELPFNNAPVTNNNVQQPCNNQTTDNIQTASNDSIENNVQQTNNTQPVSKEQEANNATVANNVSETNNTQQINNSQQIPNNQQSNNVNPIKYQPEKTKSGIPVLIGFLLFICLLCYLMFFVGGGSSNEDDNTSKNNESSNIENNNNTLPDNSITSVKKQSYIRTANAFVSSIRTQVNSSKKLKFFETNIMYLVPVGDNNKCAYLEYGETSPFSKTWNYAFVGVKYDGTEYTYYFVSEDGSNIGIEFVSTNKIDEDNIFSNYNESNINKELSDKLIKLYNISSNEEVSDNDIINLIKQEDSSINKVIVISSTDGCKY